MSNLAFWHSSLLQANLNVYSVRVYLDLVMRSGSKKANDAWPSVSTIAETCGMCDRQVMRSIKDLEKSGLVRVKRTFGKGSRYVVRTLEEWHAWKGITPETSDSQSPVTNSHGLTSDSQSPDRCIPVTTPVTDSHTKEILLKRYSKEIEEEEEDAAASPLPQNADAQYHDLSEKEADQTPNPLPPQGRNGNTVHDTLFADSDRPEPEKKKRVTKERGRAAPKRPSIEELVEYAIKKAISEDDARDQYESWVESDWKDGNGKPVLNAKSTLFNYKKIGNLPSDKRKRIEANNSRYSGSNRNLRTEEEHRKLIEEMAHSDE